MKDSKRAWKPKNKKWMANREQEWEKVKVRLLGIEGLNRDDWWDVEDHFFRGKPLPPYSRSFQPMDRLVLSWWLAPERGRFEDSAPDYIQGVRRDFIRFYSSLYGIVANRGGDPDYGVMGGIEQDIISFLERGWDPRKLVDFGGGKLQPCCSGPLFVFGYWLTTMDQEIESECYIAHKIGLMYFDYVIEMMEHLPHAAFMHIDKASTCKGKVKNPLPLHRSTLRAVVPKLLGFFDRDPEDAALKRPVTVNYVRRFVEGYEHKTFPKGLLDTVDATLESIEEDERKRKARNARQRELRNAKAKNSSKKMAGKKTPKSTENSNLTKKVKTKKKSTKK